MKPLIDLSKAAGKTVEKAVLSKDDECLAVHFTDGTALLLFSGTTCGEPNIYVINNVGMLTPSEVMCELDICTEEERQEFIDRTSRERESRLLAIRNKYPAVFGCE